MSACKSCSASITWGLTVPGGKRIPLTPDPGGNVVELGVAGGELMVKVMKSAERVTAPAGKRWRAHFVDCPAASQHRARSRGRARR